MYNLFKIETFMSYFSHPRQTGHGVNSNICEGSMQFGETKYRRKFFTAI